MSEILQVEERRIEVYQDNYGNWRWVAIEAGEAVSRSTGYFDTQEDALEDLEETGNSATTFVDGISEHLSKLPPPPKVNALLEAQQGGYQQQKEMTPEQLAIAEATREKLRNMQEAADATVAEQTALREAALVTSSPDEGMGLDGGPSEKKAPSRARARGKKDAAPVEVPNDPLAKQVAGRIDPEAA